MSRWFAIFSVIFTSIALLSACGGGSTGGVGTQNSPHVGTYSGSVNLTATASGVPTVSATDVISVYIRPDGTVLLGDSENIFAVGTLNGDTFSFTGAASVLADDTSCTGTITITGTVSNGTGTGTISSSGVVCGGVAINFTGSYTGNRTSTSASVSSVLQEPSRTMSGALRRITK